MYYKDYEKRSIGGSDIATVILVGYKSDAENGLFLYPLDFGIDGEYDAYIVDGNAEIGEHYKEVACFESWLKIYDDTGLACHFSGRKIKVFRAASMGCIIQVIDY